MTRQRSERQRSERQQSEQETRGPGGAAEESGGEAGDDSIRGAVPEELTRQSPGMSNAGPTEGATDPAARTRGATARSIGGTGTAGPGSDATDAGGADDPQ
jgi:hypothetical protein